jgi:hypothetical protein
MEKYTFTTKLHEACGNDELRPIFMCVHFMNGFAYASDGSMVIKQSLEYHSILEDKCLEGKSIHKDNYKAIMTFDKATCDDQGVACENADGRTAYFEYFDRKNTKIPEFDLIMKLTGRRSIEFIGIAPELLYRLSKAMHSPSGMLRMEFQGVDKPIFVDAVGIENQFAMIMPAILNDTLFK